MSTRRARSRQPDETLTAEFTSGQLIIGICAALFVALTCFLLGVVVGKVDPSTSGDATNLASTTVDAERNGGREGRQTSQASLVDRVGDESAREVRVPPRSRRDVADATSDGDRVITAPAPVRRDTSAASTRSAVVERERPVPVTVRPAGSSAADDASTASPLPKPKPTDLPPPANMDQPGAATPTENTEKKPMTAAVNIPLKELPAIESKPTEAPVAKPAPEPAAKPVKKPVVAPKPVAAPKPVVEAPKPAPPAARSGDGAFGVQVASFQGGDRKERASEFQRRLRENAGITAAKIFPSEDGAAQRVILVGYPDKAAASKACAELRKKEAFKGAFVKALP